MLTDAKARAAKPKSKPYKLGDSNRLFLLVNPGGSKLWRWSYLYDGKDKSMALGAYPIVGLADARRKRDELRIVLDAGRDPAIQRKLKVEEGREAARNTFEKVARLWHGHAKAQWSSKHAKDVIDSLEREVFPVIGDLPICDITPPLVLEPLHAVESRGAIETAHRLRQRISATFCYAIAKGWAQTVWSGVQN